MTPSSLNPLPEELIDQIISHFDRDVQTLRSCALVSHVFYSLTHRYLFHSIVLNGASSVALLAQFLSRNSGLSAYIRCVHIPYPHDEDTLHEIIKILPALSHTRNLIIGTYLFPGMFIISFFISKESIKLLIPILQLPLLDTLEIRWIYFPVELLHVPQGIRSLTINNSHLAKRGGIIEEIHPLLHLSLIWVRDAWSREYTPETMPIINAPNLSKIVIDLSRNKVQWNFRTGMHSIETVIWTQDIPESQQSNHWLLRKLRRLCFVLCTEGDRYGLSSWRRITKLLHSQTTAQSLEEISLAIPRKVVVINKSGLVHLPQFLGHGKLWADLVDAHQFPKLMNVSIHLFDDDSPRTKDKRQNGNNLDWPILNADIFHSAIAMELQPLAEQGILETSINEEFDWRGFIY